MTLHPRLRRWAHLTAASIVMLLLAACAGLLGPRDIEVSEAQLQRQLAKRFPYSNRYFELFDVTVSSPKVTLLPETNRIGTEVDIRISDRLSRRPFDGFMQMNYGLRFEPADNTIRLASVRVDRFVIDGSPGLLQGQNNRLGALLAEQLLDNQVLHTLKPEDLRSLQGRGYRPGELTVRRGRIVLTLDPIP